MTDAWDGRPQNPERDGWHWLLDGNHEPYLLQWGSDNQRWGDYPGTSATDLAEFGIGYLGPCLTPAEVAASIEAARRDEREACAALCEAWAKMDADIGALKAAVTRILGPDWPDDGLPVARAREWAATREYTARGLADAIRARDTAGLAAVPAQVNDDLARLVMAFSAEVGKLRAALGLNAEYVQMPNDLARKSAAIRARGDA
jgi:hypothetical protein